MNDDWMMIKPPGPGARQEEVLKMIILPIPCQITTGTEAFPLNDGNAEQNKKLEIKIRNFSIFD